MASKKTRPIYLLSPSAREGLHLLPMITFSLMASEIDFSVCDTLMFSSKQAVKSAELIDTNWKQYPCIAIGGATKKQIEALGGRVIHHPVNFYADVLAEDIIQHFSTRKLLYLRPKKVSFDSKRYLQKAGIFLHEQVIYRTSCLAYDAKEAPAEGAIIIFTSPSSIDCFLKNFVWQASYTAVVIGHATKVHLPEGVSWAVADVPLIDACVDKARELQSY